MKRAMVIAMELLPVLFKAVKTNRGHLATQLAISSFMENQMGSISALTNPDDLHSDQPRPPVINSSPLVTKLRKLLFRRMLVGVNDGRFFLGALHCIDKQGNIILQDAVEYRSTRRSGPSPMDQRCLGLILIPSSCRTSCHVDCSIEEQMSLLSLQ